MTNEPRRVETVRVLIGLAAGAGLIWQIAGADEAPSTTLAVMQWLALAGCVVAVVSGLMGWGRKP